MKYIVIGNSAVLASGRTLDRDANKSEALVKVVNVPDGATLNIIGENVTRAYPITSATTYVDFSSLEKGVYTTMVEWTTIDGVRHEAEGTPFEINEDANKERYIIAAPLSWATEVDKMWGCIADVLNVLIPLNDDFRNGNNVV